MADSNAQAAGDTAAVWEHVHQIRAHRVVIDVTGTETDAGQRYTFRLGRITGREGEEKRSGFLRAKDVEDALAALDELRDWLVAQGALD